MASIEDVRDDIIAGFAAYGGRSLTKLGFIALEAMYKGRLPCQTWRMTPWQNWLRSQSYVGLDDLRRSAKLALHLHSYLRGMEVDLIDVETIGPESSQNQCNTALRRQLDCLAGANTRSKPREPVPEPEPELGDIVIDANNRFSILFGKHGAEEDHTFYLDPEIKMDPPASVGLTLEEKRYKTQAESNVSRKKMGYAPKGNATVDSAEYARVAQKAKQPDAIRILTHKIFRPLFEWRKEFLIPYRDGKITKQELTIVPLTLLGVYEQWFQTHLDAFGGHPPPLRKGGMDGVPRVWDTHPYWDVPEELGISVFADISE
jgi:hypothetical protein